MLLAKPSEKTKPSRSQRRNLLSRRKWTVPLSLALKVNKVGNVVGDKGVVGRVVGGSLKALVGKTVDAEGLIRNEVGKVIGRAEPIPEDEKEERVETPFEDFPGAIVKKNGDIELEGQKIGEVVQGDAKQLTGKTVDPEGDIVDKYGTVLGKLLAGRLKKCHRRRPLTSPFWQENESTNLATSATRMGQFSID